MLSPQWLDELRARTSLSGVIGRSLRLIKAGREWKACCPFHNEKSPSFTVNDDKHFYHCFGCGAHGDAIRWLVDQRGIEFIDAVKELAGEAGMELPAPDPRAAAKAERQAGLGDALAAAQAWFVGNLAGVGGSAAHAYLARRGFDAATMQRFGFGYAPEGRQALRQALARFSDELLIEAGLRIAVEDKEPYDRFRGRLMLPIEDARGRIIGFGGRILDTAVTDAPKYLNSPDTPLFDKGRTLYNLHRAGPLARKSGRLVVVEGYMDAIALAAAGIEAVAPLGTALTERQIELAWRVVETPVLCFDGDGAGTRAAVRAALRTLPLLRPGHTLRVARLPAGLDPDDLVRRDGPVAMERVLTGAESLIDLLWEHELGAAPLAAPEAKAALKARLVAHADTIADRDIRAMYRREWLDRFSAHAFPRRDMRAAPPSRPIAETRARGSQDTGAALTRAIVAGLVCHPQEIARHGELLARLSAEEPCVAAMLDHADRGAPLETPAIRATLAERGLAVDDAHSTPSGEALSAMIAKRVEEPLLDAAIRAATERLDFDEQQRLRRRKHEINRRVAESLRVTEEDAGSIRVAVD